MTNLGNYIYLIAPVTGWMAAQGIKYGLKLRKNGFQWADLTQSGGMPSSHTAFMTALATAIAATQGFESGVFAISFALTALVAYDATGVRRTTGEQTAAINQLATHNSLKLGATIHNARGHLPSEVFGGLITGVVVGCLLYAILF